MLVQEFTVNKYGDFKTEKNHDKKRIILCSTNRNITDYLIGLKYRYLKEYSRIPHYIVTKTGTVLQLLNDTGVGYFFQDHSIDNESIVVCYENLGWMEKEVQNNGFKDCFGNIYKEVEVFEKKWRNKIYWDSFTEQQKNVSYQLLDKICAKNNINKKFIGHNTKVKGFEKFEGVLIKSNISQKYLDLNPSFDYEYLKKQFDENEFI
jgi:hypothetical protein